MRYRLAACLLAMTFAMPCAAQAPDPAADYGAIREGMSHLAPLVGKWRAVAQFYDPQGKPTRRNVGTYDIHWALDQTYLEYEVNFHREDDASRTHGFLIFVTFNPRDRKYHSTYFYTRWALEVRETGEYDAANRQFRTAAFIRLEDGARDENVRTITDLSKSDEVHYIHYSRFNDEKAERMDMDVRMVREK